MTAKFTLEQLIDADACSEQVALFKATFGDSVNVTVAKARKVAGLFDWDFAMRFLDAEGKAEYKRAIAPAWAEYERAIAPAWAEYERAIAPALAEYERVRDAAWAEYERAIAPAWASAYIATCKRRAA